MSEKTALALGAHWFNLARHDDPEDGGTSGGGEEAPDAGVENADAERMPADAVEEPEGAPDGPDADTDVKPDSDGLGDKGKRALERERREKAAAKKEAAAAKKQLAELTKRVQDFEDRDKSELEKATAKAERAAEQAAKAVSRAVQAEVRSLATGQFADATDAVDVLMRDPSRYVDSDGEIDTDAIEADLADLLERKPHWAKSELAPAAPVEPVKKTPRPDPGQGSRGAPTHPDFRTASKDEVAAELAKYRFRQRL